MTATTDRPERAAERVGSPVWVNAGGHPIPEVKPWDREPVHARSAARPWTENEKTATGVRIATKRACNGCGSLIGDVRNRDIPETPEHPCPYDVGAPSCPVCDRLPMLADVRGECPVCTPQPGKALVVQRWLTFGWGPGAVRLPYEPPRNTLDPRHAFCADHHPACDCREAEWAEYRAEAIAEAIDHRRVRDRLRAVYTLHAPARRVRVCVECHSTWPCTTRSLAADALGWPVDEDNPS